MVEIVSVRVAETLLRVNQTKLRPIQARDTATNQVVQKVHQQCHFMFYPCLVSRIRKVLAVLKVLIDSKKKCTNKLEKCRYTKFSA